MANSEHLRKLELGTEVWNAYRRMNWGMQPDLNDADLHEEYLYGADLREADLTGANLYRTDLREADLRNAKLCGANLRRAVLGCAKPEYVPSEADFYGANLCKANLYGADLREANLTGANLCGADLRNTDLRQANLTAAVLVGCKLDGADLTGCLVYGVSVWDTSLGGAVQRDLIITQELQPDITVDSLEVSQFVYLLLNNAKIREVIDTITSKAVLILGRFTPERKRTLDALRDALRSRNYLPIVFDFVRPGSRNFTETVLILARLSRFVIADLTDARSVIQEVTAIMHDRVCSKVPVRPLLLDDQREWAMFSDYLEQRQMIAPLHYTNDEMLLACLESEVIAPAEQRAREFAGK
jgi:hypothetical protein